MSKLYNGLITLFAIGTLAYTGCSDTGEYKGELTRKNSEGKEVTANVSVNNEFYFTLDSHERPVLTEILGRDTTIYYLDSWKNRELVKIGTINNGEESIDDKTTDPKMIEKGQRIVDNYLRDIEKKKAERLH